jgi:zinc and cadmium transporter
VSFLIAFAAGNFIYIGATDLVPEVTKHANARLNLINLLVFILGLVSMFLIRLTLES